jgi:hypothetical protein
MKFKISKFLYSFFVVVLYLVSGLLVLLKYSVWQEEPSMRLSLFGIAVMIYGLFRGYRGYREYQNQKKEQNEN